jgi:hypothetical protein
MHHAARRGQAVLVGRAIQLAKQRTTTHACAPRVGIHDDVPHRLKIERDAAVRLRQTRYAVAPGPDGYLETLTASVAKRCNNITRRPTPRD